MNTLHLTPIGFVKTEATGNEVKDKERVSKIILHEDLTEALKGVEGFSHLFILFWMHEIPDQKKGMMKVHPRGRKNIPLQGVFATRTPLRPNPIGLTVVKLVRVENNVLTVRGLDAFNETPVLDIKPCDFWDTSQDLRVPEWWTKMEKERSE